MLWYPERSLSVAYLENQNINGRNVTFLSSHASTTKMTTNLSHISKYFSLRASQSSSLTVGVVVVGVVLVLVGVVVIMCKNL